MIHLSRKRNIDRSISRDITSRSPSTGSSSTISNQDNIDKLTKHTEKIANLKFQNNVKVTKLVSTQNEFIITTSNGETITISKSDINRKDQIDLFNLALGTGIGFGVMAGR